MTGGFPVETFDATTFDREYVLAGCGVDETGAAGFAEVAV